MPSRETKLANQELLDAAALLVDEWPSVPTGSVLRCFSRAVWIVRGNGCAEDGVAAEAMSLARALLDMRAALVADDVTAVMRAVPAQRRPGGVQSTERGRRGAWTPSKR